MNSNSNDTNKRDLSSIVDFEKALRERFEQGLQETLTEQKRLGHIEEILEVKIIIDVVR